MSKCKGYNYLTDLLANLILKLMPKNFDMVEKKQKNKDTNVPQLTKQNIPSRNC